MAGGGLMQIVAYGAQDVYLTGNPEITFFKIQFRRYTNFSVESVEQFFNGTTNFGKKCTCEIARQGDLITQVFLKVVLPEVHFTGDFSKFGHVEFAWVRRIGHAIIDEVELEIGGTRIDKQYGDWLNIWYEVSRKVGQEVGYARMIGDVPALTEISSLKWDDPSNNCLKERYTLYVPLQFYFCRNNGLALPLIALQYHQVRIYVKFRHADCLYISSEAFRSATNCNLELEDASLYVNYVYLDTEERRRFAQNSHEYLIEQLQYSEESIGNSNIGKFKLNFNHPTKALYWIVRLGNYHGCRFMVYNPYDWEKAREDAAKLILLSQYDLDDFGFFSNIAISQNEEVYIGENNMEYIGVNPVDPREESLFILNDTEVVDRFDGSVLIGRLPESIPLLKRKGNKDLRCKVDGIVRIHVDHENDDMLYPVVEKITKNDLTMFDLSTPIDKFEFDNRNCYVKNFDVNVYIYYHYGLLIDGSINPVREALIQLNGQDRQSKRSGFWYNNVEAYMHYPNIPSVGINIYSFALNPVDAQPSGTCNFSRIDNAQLQLWFQFDGNCCDYNDIFVDSNNQVRIYATNYNILRIMSGMGGLAYSN